MIVSTRRLLIASLIAFALITLFVSGVEAQSWNSWVTTGLTTVEVFQDGEGYLWVLRNNSSLPGDTGAQYDVLVWELIPFFVREPRYWSSPEGWTWTGDRWELADKSRKYYTPYAIGPGQSAEFRYVPDPNGRLINGNSQGTASLEGPSFLTHVAAVIANSGASDGSKRWIPASAECGSTWFDRAVVSAGGPVAEAPGLVVLSFGLAGLCSFFRRKQ